MDGRGRFDRARLNSVVTITPESDRELALALHGDAHRARVIANSVDRPVDYEAIIHQ